MHGERCPKCERLNTERQATFYHADSVEVVKICLECPTEFTLRYEQPVVEDVTTHEDFDG